MSNEETKNIVEKDNNGKAGWGPAEGNNSNADDDDKIPNENDPLHPKSPKNNAANKEVSLGYFSQDFSGFLLFSSI